MNNTANSLHFDTFNKGHVLIYINRDDRVAIQISYDSKIVANVAYGDKEALAIKDFITEWLNRSKT